MTPHIEAGIKDYSELVLMPGDPLRAKYIAEKFFDRPRLINSIRSCFGYSGFYKGKRVSVQASGMGQPSLGIYATELFKFYAVEKIIRVGTCGAFNSEIGLGNIILAESACSDSVIGGFTSDVFVNADTELINDFKKVFPSGKLTAGRFLSTDKFYVDQTNWWRSYAVNKVLGVDMETHYLYCLAKKYNKKAITVNLVVDNLETKDAMLPSERVTNIDDMVAYTLEACFLGHI
jgi:purine-nucleoside phosphorylase